MSEPYQPDTDRPEDRPEDLAEHRVEDGAAAPTAGGEPVADLVSVPDAEPAGPDLVVDEEDDERDEGQNRAQNGAHDEAGQVSADTSSTTAAADHPSDSADPDSAEDDESEQTEGSDAEDGEDASAGSGEDALEGEGEIAADYLEELLDIADLDGDIDTYVESGRAHVSVVTDSTVLVGKDGEVLDALQELVRLAVVTETGHRSRLMLDVAGHRDRRRQELVELAGDAVQEAKTGGESIRLSPMNPFERKIVHDTVAAAGLTSESEGEEPHRRVVVIP